MAGEDKVLKVLLQIQSDISDLGKLKTGVDDLKKSLEDTSQAGFSLGDAFKFAGAEEALKGVLDGLKEVGAAMVDVVKNSVEKAAEIQTEEFPLTQMLRDSGEVGKQVLEGLGSAWQEFGVISNESLAKAAQGFTILGTPAENLIARLTEASKISVGFGIGLEDVVSAYARFQTAIMNNTEVMTRGIGGFGLAAQALLQVLEDHFGKTKDQIQSMLKAGQISINDLNMAMREAAVEGGRFADVFAAKRATFEGAITAMETAWQGFEQKIGKPIIDWATPYINEITRIEKALAKVAEDEGWQAALEAAWATITEELEKDFGKIAQDERWKNAIKAAWEVLAAEIAVIIQHGISSGFDAAISATGVPSEAKALADIYHQAYNAEFSAKIAEGKTKLQADWAATNAAIWAVMKAEVVGSASDTGEAAVGSLSSAVKEGQSKLKAALAQLFSPVKTSVAEAKKEFEDAMADEGEVPSIPVLPTETPETLNKVTKASDALKEAMKELETAMQGVKQQQQLIQQNPFISADEKEKQSVQSLTQELNNLEAQIQKLETLKASGLLSGPELADVNQKLQQSNFQVKLLQENLSAKQSPYLTDLINWANSFGTTSHQVFTSFKTVADDAFNSLNQYIITGKFNLQSFLQSIELIGLKLLEQLAIQQIVAAIGDTAAVTSANIVGPQVAAAWAGAATAVSTATFGGAAGIGATAELAALSTIQSALGGGSGGGGRGFREGGYTGDGSPDEIAGPAHRREFYFTAEETAVLGIPFLQGLAANAGGVARFAREGSDMSVTEAGRLATGGDDPSTFVPPTLTRGGDSPYTPTWMQSQPYWGDQPDSSRPQTPAEYIAWNQPPMPSIGAPSVDIPTYQNPSAEIRGGSPTVETPTGPSDIPNEYIAWNAPPMPNVYPSNVEGGGVPPENIDWNAPPMPNVFTSVGGRSDLWDTYGRYYGGSPGFDVLPGGQISAAPGGSVAGYTHGTGPLTAAQWAWFLYPAGMRKPSYGSYLASYPAGNYGGHDIGGAGGLGGVRQRHTGGPVGDEFSLLQQGEFVMPKWTVDHYGLSNMEGLRNLSVPRGGDNGSGSLRKSSGEVHVHNYTDLKALARELASREGQQIIVDTVRGRRIDLGIRR
jgi:hypothetical protein